MIVKNNTVRIIMIMGVRLMPGVNQLDDKKWEEIKEGLAGHIEDDLVESLEDKKEDDFADGSKAFSAKDAIKLVKETADEDLLKEWLMTEDRKSVVEAIEKKLKEIEEAVKDGDGDDKE